MAEPFPWRAAMRFAVGELGIAPHDFWRMTPRELAMLVPDGVVPLDRERLRSLIERYPDGES